MWSEPTPPGGVRGPLVVVDDLANVTAAQKGRLRGAFLLTKLPGRGATKVFAAEVGAAAVVSDFVPHVERHPEAIGWSNAWADDPGAWALKASDCRMTGFQISPPTGRRLRELAARGAVTCEALVTGRVGPGVLPVVTGVVPGESQEEVLLLGHLYEVGVVDNASGCAAMMEAVRLMAAMPRPARTVRILLTSECYGTYAFFTQRPEVLRRTLAGANLDCVAGEETPDRPRHWSGTNECLPSASDVLFGEALRATEVFPKALPAERDPFGMSDNMIGDPAAGAPCVCLMGAPWHWHTSRDDWSGLSPEALRRSTVVAASWARWLAEARPPEADALAEAAAVHTRKTCGGEFSRSADRLAFHLDRGRERILSTRRLGATRAESIAAEFPPMELSDFPPSGGRRAGGGGARPRARFLGRADLRRDPAFAARGPGRPAMEPSVCVCRLVGRRPPDRPRNRGPRPPGAREARRGPAQVLPRPPARRADDAAQAVVPRAVGCAAPIHRGCTPGVCAYQGVHPVRAAHPTCLISRKTPGPNRPSGR